MSSSDPLRGDARLGTVLRGKYRLDRVIGTGGMAVVYKATHRNQAEFAVKMLHPELSSRADIRSRFVREGYAANAVKHPGAVVVVDDDVAEDGAAFLVMELLHGIACDRLWEFTSKRVPVEVASAVAIQVLGVLEAAHEKGIVHRDIKPANLFLTRSGVVKVLDFGIARARDAIVGAQATETGTAPGTPAFMAPEQARGRSREIDGRTDLWAVGATFFAMVSGQLVHEAETANEFLIAAGTRQARSLAMAAPEVPPQLVDVMDRALAFEKGVRWPTAAVMQNALVAAHRASFGRDNLEELIALAVERHAPPEEPILQLSPAAETSTSWPVSGQLPTERGSTYGASAREREPAPPRSRRWPLSLGAAALVAACAAVWFRGHLPRTGGTDAGAGDALVTTVPDAAAVVTAPLAQERTVAAVTIRPKSATVAVDGQPVVLDDGLLRLERRPGTTALVRVVEGDRSIERTVVITNNGTTLPSQLELPGEPPASSAPVVSIPHPPPASRSGGHSTHAPSSSSPPADSSAPAPAASPAPSASTPRLKTTW